MKNKLIIIGLLCALSFNLFAQKSKNVTYTKKKVKLSSNFVHDAFSINSSEIVLMSYVSPGITVGYLSYFMIKKTMNVVLHKIDDDLNVVQKKTLKATMYGKRVWIEKILKIGNEGWMLFSYNNVETKKNYLFAQKFDYHNFETTDEPIKIAEMPYSNSRYFTDYYEYNLSENGKLLMIAGIPTKSKSSSSSGITIWVYNQNMEVVNYVKKIKLSGRGSVKSTAIGDDGSFIIVGMSPKAKEKSKKKFKDILMGGNDLNYEYLLFNYDSTGESHDYYFSNTKMLLTDIKAAINNNTGNYCLMGIYTDNKKGAKGVVCAQLSSSDFSEVSLVKKPFTDEFIKNANKKFDTKTKETKKKTKKKKSEDEEKNDDDEAKPKSKYLGKLDKNKKESEEKEDSDKDKKDDDDEKESKKSSSKEEIANLTNIVDIVFDKNDNPIGVFEKRWITVKQTRSYNTKTGVTTTTTTYYYYYGDVVISKIEDGELRKSKIIRKEGYTVDISYPQGISVVTNDDNVILSYGDNQIDFDKEDLSSKYKNADTRREKSYRMSGFQKKLAPNKSLVTTPRGFKRVELEYIRAK